MYDDGCATSLTLFSHDGCGFIPSLSRSSETGNKEKKNCAPVVVG